MMTLLTLRAAALVSVLAVVAPISAATYRLPAENPIGIVQISDKWKTKSHHEFVETESPDRQIEILVVAVEGRKVAEAMGETLRYIRRNGAIAINAKSIKKDSIEVKKKQVHTVSWDATDTGRPVKIRCYVVPTIEGRSLLVVFRGSLEAAKKHHRDVDKILQSIGPP